MGICLYDYTGVSFTFKMRHITVIFHLVLEFSQILFQYSQIFETTVRDFNKGDHIIYVFGLVQLQWGDGSNTLQSTK